MKKTLLTMGTLVSIGAPIATVVACGDNKEKTTVYNENTRVEITPIFELDKMTRSNADLLIGESSFDVKKEMETIKAGHNNGGQTHHLPMIKDIKTIQKVDYKVEFQVEWVADLIPSKITSTVTNGSYYSTKRIKYTLEDVFDDVVNSHKDKNSFSLNLSVYNVLIGNSSTYSLMPYSEIQTIFSKVKEVISKTQRPKMKVILNESSEKNYNANRNSYYSEHSSWDHAYGGTRQLGSMDSDVIYKSKKDANRFARVRNILIDSANGSFISPEKPTNSPWTFVKGSIFGNITNVTKSLISDADLNKLLA